MLQRVAMCCSVLHCEVVFVVSQKKHDLFHCRSHDLGVLQRVAACCSMLQHVAACCSMLQRVAMCCSVLQCEVVFVVSQKKHDPFHCRSDDLGVVLCNKYNRVVACCSVLQRVAAW